jgi:hypothetical protein
MSIELNFDDMEYDPSIARAAVRRHGSDWRLLLERTDATPVHLVVVDHREIVDEVGAEQSVEHEAVMGFIEQRLNAAGYSAVREGGDFPNPFIGAWQLGPKG